MSSDHRLLGARSLWLCRALLFSAAVAAAGCGGGEASDTPSLPTDWGNASVFGNGNLLTVDTCGFNTNFDSKIGVYTGFCGGLSCVSSDASDPCNSNAALTAFCSVAEWMEVSAELTCAISALCCTVAERMPASRSATVAGRSNFVSRSIGTRGSFPETISAMNFGSQTFSASCLDVTGAVAPRANAKSSTGIR